MTTTTATENTLIKSILPCYRCNRMPDASENKIGCSHTGCLDNYVVGDTDKSPDNMEKLISTWNERQIAATLEASAEF